MAITDQNLYNTIQYHLLETANNGASYGSGLYTAAEVVGRTNFRLDLFNKLTNVQTTFAYPLALTSGNKYQDYSSEATDVIDILSVFYSSDNRATWYNIPRGSSFEGDSFITDQSAVTLPGFYTLDTASSQSINFFPAPSFSLTNGRLGLIYVKRLGTMPATPDGTTIGLQDDFTPFVKYGVLADLFGKSGETYDPARAQICEDLFNLGVETVRDWISGSDLL